VWKWVRIHSTEQTDRPEYLDIASLSNSVDKRTTIHCTAVVILDLWGIMDVEESVINRKSLMGCNIMHTNYIPKHPVLETKGEMGPIVTYDGPKFCPSFSLPSCAL
jgi:hypothetical protein